MINREYGVCCSSCFNASAAEAINDQTIISLTSSELMIRVSDQEELIITIDDEINCVSCS